jgi:cell division protein FtsL
MSLVEKIALTASLVAWAIGAIRTLFENRRLIRENRELQRKINLLERKIASMHWDSINRREIRRG